MAKQTIEKLIDDLDGSGATQTIEFAYKGKCYTLDLNDNNASELADALAPYIAAAGKAGTAQSSRGGRGGKRQAAASSGRSSSDYSPKDVRAWAQANGVECRLEVASPARSSSSTRRHRPEQGDLRAGGR